MLTRTQSADTWQSLIEMRCRQEIIERWLASQIVPPDLQRSLSSMLHEVEGQLRSLTNTSSS